MTDFQQAIRAFTSNGHNQAKLVAEVEFGLKLNETTKSQIEMTKERTAQLRARLDVLEKRKHSLLRESKQLEATVEDLKRRCTVRQGLLLSSSRALNVAKAANTATEDKLLADQKAFRDLVSGQISHSPEVGGEAEDDALALEEDEMSTTSSGVFSESSGERRSSSTSSADKEDRRSSGSSGSAFSTDSNDRRSSTSSFGESSFSQHSKIESEKSSGVDPRLLSQIEDCVNHNIKRQQTEVMVLKETITSVNKARQNRKFKGSRRRNLGEDAASSSSSSSAASSSPLSSPSSSPTDTGKHAAGTDSSTDNDSHSNCINAIHACEAEVLFSGAVPKQKLKLFREMFRLLDTKELMSIDDLLEAANEDVAGSSQDDLNALEETCD